MHLYWGHTPLSYLHYLTVASFHLWNPDWKIILWHPGNRPQISAPWKGKEHEVPYTGEDWMPKVQALPYVDWRELPEYVPQGLHDVFCSDFLRWYALTEFGGIWSDFDILYIKPIEATHFRWDEYDFTWMHDGSAHIIGFFLAMPGTKFFRGLMEQAPKRYRADTYQSVGSDLIRCVHGINIDRRIFDPHVPLMLPMEVIYPFQWWPEELHRLFTSTENFEHQATTIGIHWYNGSIIAKACLNSWGQDSLFPQTILGQAVARVEAALLLV
jgi:hypothetical protein